MLETVLVIAMIAKSNSNPVFLAARTGAEQAAKDLSAKHGVAIEIRWLTPPDEDAEAQAQRIAEAVQAKAGAILVSCSDAAKIAGAINDAADAGVPVMTFDSDAPESKRFAYYGVDDAKTGRMVMAELAALLGGKGKVAILAGNQNAPNLQKRVAGVKEEAARHPGIEIAGTYYHTETPQDATAKVVEVQHANPEIAGWAFVGGWPLFAQGLLDEIDPAKVKIASVDALPAELPYVERGVVPVLLAQPTYLWGYVSVERIVDRVALKKEVPAFNEMELVRVSKENLGDWARKLKGWGFEVDGKYLEMDLPEKPAEAPPIPPPPDGGPPGPTGGKEPAERTTREVLKRAMEGQRELEEVRP